MTPAQLYDLTRAIDFTLRAADTNQRPHARASYAAAAERCIARLTEHAPLTAELGGLRLELTRVDAKETTP